VADILRNRHTPNCAKQPIGFVDDDPALLGRSVNGVPILGNWSWFETAKRDEFAVICAIGLPEVRKQLVKRATEIGLTFCSAISSSARISPEAEIGVGVMIFPNASVSTNCFVGDHAIISVGSTISHDTRLDSFATLNPGVHVAGDVSIGEGCYLGVGASVIQQVSIGSWSTVGAGAAVVDNLPENVTAVGVPARPIATREKGWHERVTGSIRQ
jgi:sugar O-acyltransferase (sialic acid O-acetyltransferase NeuD family)